HLLHAACGLRGEEQPLAPDIYYRRAFNQYGDLVSFIGKAPQKPWGSTVRYRSGAATEAIEQLNEFHQFCRQRGVRVYVTHQPLAESLFRQSERNIRLLETELRQTLTVPILETPEQTMFPPEDFFDTYHHLNPEGRRKRSEQLAERLMM